eukprot:13824913-Alexandrium_andersonii.AAC.1
MEYLARQPLAGGPAEPSPGIEASPSAPASSSDRPEASPPLAEGTAERAGPEEDEVGTIAL